MEADLSAWSDFFVASAGATAALAGLVFVAVSINIDSIVDQPGVPEFALVTVLLLLQAVVVSLLGLVPDQDTGSLGIQLLVEFVIWAAVAGAMIRRSLAHMKSRVSLVSRLVLPALGSLPFLVAAVILLGDREQGMDWVAGGIIASTVAAVVNGWVLMVEIRR
jgi:modulator of FtsH protease